MTFKLESHIRETVPAWTECEICWQDTTVHPCTCQGAGGRWHEAVELLGEIKYKDDHWLAYVGEAEDLEEVTKSSLLTRTHEPCSVCWGSGYLGIFETDSCPHCQVNGQPTGAEPGTAGPWEVVKQ